MTYNHFLAYANTLRSRVHLMIAALVEDITAKYPQSQQSICTAFLQAADALALKVEHDKYFQAIKSVYPYAQGRVLYHHNKVIQDNFWSITHKHVIALSGQFIQHLDNLAKDCPIQCLEVYSVQKCFFFPEINLEEGVNQQFDRMRRKNSDAHGQSEAGTEILWMFRKEYIKGYVRKHRVWPNCSVGRNAHPMIKSMKSLNEWPSGSNIPYTYFKDVLLQYQGDPLQFEPDLSDIVTNKAIIESRAHWTYEYNARAYSDKLNTKLRHLLDSPGDKRLIKTMLNGKLEDIKKILEPYVSGTINSTSLVTILVPKEKELKVKGRFFSEQSLETRIYQ